MVDEKHRHDRRFRLSQRTVAMSSVSGLIRILAVDRSSASARKILGILLVAMAVGACRKPSREPVTLTFFRPGWSQHDQKAERLLGQFTQETGIRVKDLPVPESTLDSMNLSRKLLGQGASGPDVLGLDAVWSGILEQDLVDLRPSSAAEISQLRQELIPTYTIGGKLVAIPYRVQIGALEYRTDLLREYGYDHPPTTWDELERMALRIQQGERAKGKKDFWGYVWQGAPTEGLTCNALEWQFAEGGGRIVENDRTISVNNPSTIRAWQRARHWIGWISPPSVLSYRETDSMNIFDSGGAAFNRAWAETTITPTGQPRLIHWRDTLAVDRTGYTSIPGGPGGRAGTLGGSGLAVSLHSNHPQEGIELVRFMTRAQIQSMIQTENNRTSPPGQPETYDLPSITDPPELAEKPGQHRSGVINRPSSVTGRGYEQVTAAYIAAVHSVLTGERGAPEAAAALEKLLVEITGFHAVSAKRAK
jgi:trehalose/maltose transport system substrate-binding protein